MTHKKRKFLNVFGAAHQLGYEVPATRPAKDDTKGKAAAMRGIRAFYMAISRGKAPPPDGQVNGRNRWYEATLDAFMEAAEEALRTRAKKKAGDCSNNHQPKATRKPVKESRGKRNLPHQNRNVNGEDGAVRHG